MVETIQKALNNSQVRTSRYSFIPSAHPSIECIFVHSFIFNLQIECVSNEELGIELRTGCRHRYNYAIGVPLSEYQRTTFDFEFYASAGVRR